MNDRCDKNEKLIQSNKGRITSMATNISWIKRALEEQKKILAEQTRIINNINQTVHNGLSQRVAEMHKQIIEIEDDVDKKIDKSSIHRRKEDKYKTVVMIVSMIGMFTAIGTMIASFLII